MRFYIYRAGLRHNEFRFNLVARNGKIVATSESYKRKATMLKTIAKIGSFPIHDFTDR